jgi:transcriptional regulator with XRE-family HTH domain
VRITGFLRAFPDTLGVVTTAYASEAAHIREIGNLSAADIARATGADETTARAWLRNKRSPSGERAERLFELSSLVERLVRVIKPEYVPVWLRKPNPMLDDDKPLDVIASGEYRRVSRVIAGLETAPVS